MSPEQPLIGPDKAMPDAAPIPQLVRRLLNDAGFLARAELGLAQAQLTNQIRSMIPGLIAILLGSLFALASLFTMLAALIGWLTPSLGAGNAALVVTLGTAVIGAVAIAIGVRQLSNRSAPHAERVEEVNHAK